MLKARDAGRVAAAAPEELRAAVVALPGADVRRADDSRTQLHRYQQGILVGTLLFGRRPARRQRDGRGQRGVRDGRGAQRHGAWGGEVQGKGARSRTLVLLVLTRSFENTKCRGRQLFVKEEECAACFTVCQDLVQTRGAVSHGGDLTARGGRGGVYTVVGHCTRKNNQKQILPPRQGSESPVPVDYTVTD